MNSKKTKIFVIITLISGTVSFFNARLAALGSQESPTVIKEEEKYAAEAEGLLTRMEDLQKSLDTVLDDPCAPDATIIESSDSVIKAHEQLILRVGRHIVALRKELNDKNRQYLMQLCAGAVSGPMRRIVAQANGLNSGQGQNGRGYGYGGQNSTTRGYGYRRGVQQNSNTGNGQRLRFRNRLAAQLQLTTEQITALQVKDPNFGTDILNLYEKLIAERRKLMSVFLNPDSSDDELIQQIESFISYHSRLERRILQHVLLLRNNLTIEQQKRLAGLCRRFGNT